MFAGLKQKLGESLAHTAARSSNLATQPKAVGEIWVVLNTENNRKSPKTTENCQQKTILLPLSSQTRLLGAEFVAAVVFELFFV